jgi:hypothetical protein
VLVVLPLLYVLYSAMDDLGEKDKALKLTLGGGEDWKPAEKRKVKTNHRGEDKEE